MDTLPVSKPPDDIDMIAEVVKLLTEQASPESLQAFNADRLIQEALGKHSRIQRFQLNKYWNMQLLSAVKPSHEQRYCLLTEGEISYWLKLFRETVLPFAVENGLPKTL